ncbi:MAG: hypothetical protein KAT71_06910 [Gammaproteobacteria bacterium]|nr:hypothetical protein [Gammaproteobacteria bacterium]
MVESSLKNLWGQRIAGLDLQEDMVFRPVTHSDIAYLQQKFPFLQMINGNAWFEDEIIPKFITAEKSGWVVHDYGDAMSVSPGQFLYTGWDDKALLTDLTKESATTEDDDDEGGDEGGSSSGTDEPLYTGKGSIIKQMFDTAQAMVDFAIQKGWEGIEIIDGTHTMQWAAWVAAQEKDFLLDGFEPDEEDEKRARRISEKIRARTATKRAGMQSGR